MKQRDPPEIIIRSWKSETVFKGEAAIHAAGWSLHLMLLARALRMLVMPVASGSVFLVLKWWVSS